MSQNSRLLELADEVHHPPAQLQMITVVSMNQLIHSWNFPFTLLFTTFCKSLAVSRREAFLKQIEDKVPKRNPNLFSLNNLHAQQTEYTVNTQFKENESTSV